MRFFKHFRLKKLMNIAYLCFREFGTKNTEFFVSLCSLCLCGEIFLYEARNALMRHLFKQHAAPHLDK
jgi:hypothetical protein